MRLQHRVWRSLGAGVLVASLSACGGGNAGGAGGSNAGGGNDGEAAASGRRVSLLDEYLAPVWGTNLSAEQQVMHANAQNAQREELIAQCMHEAGFEFIPNPIVNTVTPETDADQIWRPDDRAWVEQYGYAVIVSPWENIGRGEELGEANVPVDPNQAYLDSLSESERQAFNDALFGPPIEYDGETLDNMTTEDRMALMGCFGWALSEMRTEDPSDLASSDEFAPLFEAMGMMYKNMYQFPEWTEIDADWANCMADRGHPGLGSQNDAQQAIFDDLNAFWEGWDWETNPVAPSISTSPELAAIHEREMAMALTDFECREAVNYRARQDAVITAAERQFINDNQSALQALRAAAEQMGG